MARDRCQQGYVEEIGKKAKKWRGHYFVYVRSEDDEDVRKHRVVTLGLKAVFRKWEAEKKLKEIIERETGKGTAKPDSNCQCSGMCNSQTCGGSTSKPT